MWFGELITERGVGNGMSILIFSGIASALPTEGRTILESRGGLVFAIVLVVALLLISGVVFVEQGQRRIPVQYAKRMVGRRMYGGSSTYLPLKVNQAGIIPVIFASSLLYLPNLIAQLTGATTNPEPSWWQRIINEYLVNPNNPVYIALYFVDRVLRVLLRGHHVQPRGTRRRDEEVRGLHPGYPPGPAHR